MRHITMTCENHPDKRWTAKEIAVNNADGQPGSECPCPAGCLILV